VPYEDLLGPLDFDPAALRARYEQERDRKFALKVRSSTSSSPGQCWPGSPSLSHWSYLNCPGDRGFIAPRCLKQGNKQMVEGAAPTEDRESSVRLKQDDGFQVSEVMPVAFVLSAATGCAAARTGCYAK
jgi:hypothetical protein